MAETLFLCDDEFHKEEFFCCISASIDDIKVGEGQEQADNFIK